MTQHPLYENQQPSGNGEAETRHTTMEDPLWVPGLRKARNKAISRDSEGLSDTPTGNQDV